MTGLNEFLTNGFLYAILSLSSIFALIGFIVAGIKISSGSSEDVAYGRSLFKRILIGIILIPLATVAFSVILTISPRILTGGTTDQALEESIGFDFSVEGETQLERNALFTELEESFSSSVTGGVEPLDGQQNVDTDDKPLGWDTFEAILSWFVRGAGKLLANLASTEVIGFDFFFELPVDVIRENVSFRAFSVYLQILALAVAHILFVVRWLQKTMNISDDREFSLIDDTGNYFLSIFAIFASAFLVRIVIVVAQSFSELLFQDLVAEAFIDVLRFLVIGGVLTVGNPVGFFSVFLIVLLYVILFAKILFDNFKRYFVILLMAVFAPFFTLMLFHEDYERYGKSFWELFVFTCFTLPLNLIMISFVFLVTPPEFNLGSYLGLIAVMLIVANSNNWLMRVFSIGQINSMTFSMRGLAKSSGKAGYSLMRIGRKLGGA